MPEPRLTDAILDEARRLGFAAAGVVAADRPVHYDAFLRWIEQGRAARMDYLAERAEARRHPQSILPDVRSLVVLALPYPVRDEMGTSVSVVPYARTVADYHDVIRGKLNQLKSFVLNRVPSAQVRGVVDTAPLMERDFACRAGLGQFGKNTMLIHPMLGSRFFLAALLTDLTLDPTLDPTGPADERDICGPCRACLTACPTGALCEPYLLDARRCINYLTIESPELPDEDLRRAVAGHLFGCDICQRVCPWNAQVDAAQGASAEDFPPLGPIDPCELFSQDEETLRRRFGRTVLWRRGRRGLLCNAAMALAGRPDAESIAALTLGLADADPLIRQACRWAMQEREKTHAETRRRGGGEGAEAEEKRKKEG